jgi:hypothetical protein
LESLVLDDNNNLGFISFKILSKNRKIDVLKHFIKRCEEDYELDKQDKLKGKLWFFDNIPNIKQGDNNLLYLRNLFITNRNEKNIFFDNSDVVWRRLYHFMNNKSWYDIKGLPYTLGFLFYGNPGCGKTSMIKAIANITQRHIININFSNIKKKSQLKQLFYDIDLLCTNNYTTEILKIPIKDRLYVFEDIDCVNNIKVLKQRDFKKPATKAEGTKIKPDKKFDHLSQQMFNSNNVTNEEEEDDDDIDLSTVLNILDGTLENPNRIIIFTSNFPEILDKALIRPGRIDMMIEFKLASHKIIIDMYKSYYEEEPDIELVNNIPEEFWTPAELSQFYFNNLDNPKNSLEFLANKDNKIIFQAKNMVVEEVAAQVMQVEAPVEPIEESLLQPPKISICDLNDNVNIPQNIMDFISINKVKQDNKENKIISNDFMPPRAPKIDILSNNDIPKEYYTLYNYKYICDIIKQHYNEDFSLKWSLEQNNVEPIFVIKYYFNYMITFLSYNELCEEIILCSSSKISGCENFYTNNNYTHFNDYLFIKLGNQFNYVYNNDIDNDIDKYFGNNKSFIDESKTFAEFIIKIISTKYVYTNISINNMNKIDIFGVLLMAYITYEGVPFNIPNNIFSYFKNTKFNRQHIRDLTLKFDNFDSFIEFLMKMVPQAPQVPQVIDINQISVPPKMPQLIGRNQISVPPKMPIFCLTQAPQVPQVIETNQISVPPKMPQIGFIQAPQVPQVSQAPQVPQINIMDKYDETTQIDFPTLFKPQKQLDFIISTKTHFINNDDCLNKINIETKEIPGDFYSFYDYNYICDYMRKTYDEDFGNKYNKYQNNNEPLLIIKRYFDYIINNEEWDYDEKSAILITFKKPVAPSTNNDIILEIHNKWNKSIVCMFNTQMNFNSWFNIIDINKIELFEDLIENILFFSNTKAFVNYYMNNMDIISAFVYICNKYNMPQVTIPKDIFYFYYDYTFTKNEINEDFNTYNTFESYIEYLRENITLNLKQANDLLNNKIVKLELVLEEDIETSIYDNCSINYSKLLNIINEQTDNELKFYIREIL